MLFIVNIFSNWMLPPFRALPQNIPGIPQAQFNIIQQTLDMHHLLITAFPWGVIPNVIDNLEQYIILSSRRPQGQFLIPSFIEYTRR
jgi:hypothetical protein